MKELLPSPQGYFGRFGGAFIPEMLRPNILELERAYREIVSSTDFQEELHVLLRDYAGRPTPLFFAERLSAHCGAPVYLKREDLLHTGAHKMNNALGQVLLAERMGKKRIIAETGAGQHGVATASAAALRGLHCIVYMGAEDIERQSANVQRMGMLGAEVRPVHSGSAVLKDATNEAMRDWIAHPEETHYVIGSVVGPHPFPALVADFQRVISDETKQQFIEQTGQQLPKAVVACVGGGSNAIGAFFAFLPEKDVVLYGVEAAGKGLESSQTAATISCGKPGILHGMHTLVMQDDDGQIDEVYSLSAGLDYPGIGPQHAHLQDIGRVRYLAVTDKEAVAAGLELSRLEGIIPALETSHALSILPQVAKETGGPIVLCLSGRGDKDLSLFAGGEHGK